MKFIDLTRRVSEAEAALKEEKARSTAAVLELEMKLEEADGVRREAAEAVREAVAARDEARTVAVQAQDLAGSAMLAEEKSRGELATILVKVKELEGALATAEVAADPATEAAEQEFDKGFFQGYSDLKRRVAVDHPEWDLTGYSGAESDFFDVGEDEPAPEHVEAEPTDPPRDDDPPAAEDAGAEPGVGTEEVGETELVNID